MELYPKYITHHVFGLKSEKGFLTMSSAVLTSGTVRLEVDLDEDCSTLEQIIDAFRDAAGIPEGATIAVNGDTDVSDDYEVQPGDEITATKTSGSKGR
jgi:hypothetical protein